MKSKLNIISMMLGLIFTLMSIDIGYLNNFHGNSGFPLMLIGLAFTIAGFAFTPKIWRPLGNIILIIIMFFNRS